MLAVESQLSPATRIQPHPPARAPALLPQHAGHADTQDPFAPGTRPATAAGMAVAAFASAPAAIAAPASGSSSPAPPPRFELDVDGDSWSWLRRSLAAPLRRVRRRTDAATRAEVAAALRADSEKFAPARIGHRRQGGVSYGDG